MATEIDIEKDKFLQIKQDTIKQTCCQKHDFI